MISSHPIEALILDFDGTMVDTEWPSFVSWREIYAAHGATLALEEFVAVVGSDRGFDPLATLAERSTGPIDPEVVRASRMAQKVKLTQDAPLLPGVRDRMNEARDLGWKLGVASSSGIQWVEGHLSRLGILSEIDAVRTRDHVSQVKPSPEVFLKAAEALTVAPSRCVVIEDSLNGVRAAKAAGMIAIAVPNRVTQVIDFQEADAWFERMADMSLRALFGLS